MRRIERYYFCYVNHVIKRPPKQYTVFLMWHHMNGAVLMYSECPFRGFEILHSMVPVSCESEQN